LQKTPCGKPTNRCLYNQRLTMNELDFSEYIDLASERLGGVVLYANDEFFAPKENLLKPEKPIFIEDKYTEFGKWMDGWETRRRREPGYDWCLIKLGLHGRIHGVVVDTAFFRGNYPEQCSIEACSVDDMATHDELLDAIWIEILPPSQLKGDIENKFKVNIDASFTHIRLNIFPDGGVARLKVYGEVIPNLVTMERAGFVDLAAARNGARVVLSSDMFFGHRHNLIMPGAGINMGDGWETKRRRGPGHDWCIVKLCSSASIDKIEVDTSHFKGNYPDSCMIEGCDGRGLTNEQLLNKKTEWSEILTRTKLGPDKRHFYKEEIQYHGVVTHVRLNIYPDGGVSRLRLFGRVVLQDDIIKPREIKQTATPENPTQDLEYKLIKGLGKLNAMPFADAVEALISCCGSRAWAEKMAERRPFTDFREMKLMAYYVWWALDQDDWFDAFNRHPRIGDKKAPKIANMVSARWSGQEQKAAQGSSEETLKVLANANRVYEQKFDFTFIICATGKNAGEILKILYKRLTNDRKTEIHNAAEEQLKITHLRLQKLLEG